MKRKLFCEISPFTYKLSVLKCIITRHIEDLFSNENFAKTFNSVILPFKVYEHKSLIRRKLGNVDVTLQNNKAYNLKIAAPKIDRILIKPGEVFSFWRLVGSVSKSKGYKTGLAIKRGEVSSDVGGGMCQFTNLLHWLFLHTPLEICEHHHHDGVDLFPDFNRQVPFGTGTSIMYNYMDYRIKNNTDRTYQIVVFTTDEYLCGELYCSEPQKEKYHIVCENERFVQKDEGIYRKGEVYKKQIDTDTGNCVSKLLLRKNCAKIMYEIAPEKVVLN